MGGKDRLFWTQKISIDGIILSNYPRGQSPGWGMGSAPHNYPHRQQQGHRGPDVNSPDHYNRHGQQREQQYYHGGPFRSPEYPNRQHDSRSDSSMGEWSDQSCHSNESHQVGNRDHVFRTPGKPVGSPDSQPTQSTPNGSNLQPRSVQIGRGRGALINQHAQSPGNGHNVSRPNPDNRNQGSRDRSHSGGRDRNRSTSRERNPTNNSSYSSSSYNDSFSPQRYGYHQEDYTFFLSKTLSSILRHNAERFGFKLMKGGYLYVDEILRKTRKLDGYTVDDVKYVVMSNDKQRFTLDEDERGRLKIRANQGHTMEVEDLDLKPITNADDFPLVIHGTYYEAWESIKRTGLNRMKRNHIHFAPGEPGESGVISGMRSSCQVMIHLDLEKALKDGIKFFISSNNVILSPGDEHGAILPRYFDGAMDRRKGHRLDFDPQVAVKSTIQNKPDGKKKPKRGGKGKRDREDKDPSDGQQDDRESVTPPKVTASDQKPTTSNDTGAKDKCLGSDPVDDILEEPENEAVPKKQKLDESKPDQVQTDEPCDTGVLHNLQKDYEEDEVKENIEPVVIDAPELSKVTIDDLISSKPPFVVVICQGDNLGKENSCIQELLVGTDKSMFVFSLQDKRIMDDGQLKQLLLHKEIIKVFFRISDVSPSLIHEYDILMNSVPLWDIEILHQKLAPQLSNIYIDKIKEIGFHNKAFKKWAEKNQHPRTTAENLEELKHQATMMTKMFPIFQNSMSGTITKDMKKETFDRAIPMDDGHFLCEKIKQLKLEQKKETEKAKKMKSEPKQEASQSGGKGFGKQQKGGRNKKKK